MNSDQERLVHRFCQSSWGAPYLFAPDEYTKGNARREPADLVWLANGVSILMYMEGGSSLEKADAHNLKQASGWLRAWRAGRPLVGGNSFARFSIPFNPATKLVIISVVRDPLDQVRFHDEVARQFGEPVGLVVSISESLLEEAAIWGAGPVDILDILFISRQSNVPEASGQEYMHAQYAAAARLADPQFSWAGNDHGGVIAGAKRVLFDLRNAHFARHGTTYERVPQHIFNDLALVHYLRVVCALGECLKAIKSTSEVEIRNVKLGVYSCTIGVMKEFSDAGKDAILKATMETATANSTLSGGHFTITAWFLDHDLGFFPITSFTPYSGATHAEKVFARATTALSIAKETGLVSRPTR